MPAEARPIARTLGLTGCTGKGGYRFWKSGQVWMVQSGVGRVHAAAATRALAKVSPRTPDALWLNLGICGHGSRVVGELVAARSVLEVESGRSWTLPLAEALALPTDDLRTVDVPEDCYPENCAYDMEASGFLSAVRAFTRNHKVCILKVVSDNKETSTQGLTARKVEGLVAASLPGWLTAIRGVID